MALIEEKCLPLENNSYYMKYKVTSFALIIIFLVSCTIAKSVVSDSAYIQKYQYASITDVMNYSGSASLMDAEVYIYDAVASTKLTMVGDKRIQELNADQKERLLLVRFGVTQNSDETVVSVNFVDYLTGKPVASCRGASGLGLDGDGNMKGAIKKVTKEIHKVFGTK